MTYRIKYLEEKQKELLRAMTKAKNEGNDKEYKRLWNHWHTVTQELAELKHNK